LVDVWLPIFREERRAGSVKKNVTVPLWLNVLAEKAGLNFSQVLQAGLKSSLGIQDR
jgi:post-segregation antitoxin (ccd killing protein)